MKSLAHSYVWWPGLDLRIEEVCRACVECCAANRNPPKVPAHPWMIPMAKSVRGSCPFWGMSPVGCCGYLLKVARGTHCIFNVRLTDHRQTPPNI